MTYRERRERRAERLRGWADKRQTKAAADLATANKYRGDTAFNTQPGHIPERARLIARQDRAFVSLDKAAAMDSKAAEIERQADNAIYSDDHDAVERLRERIGNLEAERERTKDVNKAIRKYGLLRLVQADPPFVLAKEEARELVKLHELCPYHDVLKKGWPAYKLTNLGGNISRQRERLRFLEQAAKVAAVLAAEAHRADDPHCTCNDCIADHFEAEP